MPGFAFDRDRAIAAFLLTGTGMLVLNLLTPDLLTPIANQFFDWGGAEIVGTGGWLAICLSLVSAALAGWRRSRIV